MDATAITQLITSLGFPVVMCLIMFKYVTTLTQSHKEETKELSNQISDLKAVISEIKAIITSRTGGNNNDN